MATKRQAVPKSQTAQLVRWLRTPLQLIAIPIVVTELVLLILTINAQGVERIILIVGMLLILGAVVGVGYSLARQPTQPPRPVAAVLPVTRVKVTAADKLADNTAKPELRARVKGRVEPPIQGLRVWLLREDFARNPGHFSVESKAAVTDREGEWEQIVHLWGAAGGKFRVHAVIGPPLAEQFFTYYRTAFEHARSIYRQKVDATAQGFPGWPGLNSFPSDCLSDFRELST